MTSSRDLRNFLIEIKESIRTPGLPTYAYFTRNVRSIQLVNILRAGGETRSQKKKGKKEEEERSICIRLRREEIEKARRLREDLFGSSDAGMLAITVAFAHREWSFDRIVETKVPILFNLKGMRVASSMNRTRLDSCQHAIFFFSLFENLPRFMLI